MTSPTIRSRIKGAAGRAALVAVSVLLALGVFEIAFRVLDLRGYHAERTRDWDDALLPREERVQGVRLQFRPNSRFRIAYDSNPRGYFDENNGLTYVTNALGFRGPDRDPAKAPGTRRVIVLGDSFTFGEGVRDEDVFAGRLERILADDAASPVEVLNFAASSWATQDEIEFLARRGIEYSPDLVIVVFVLNDADYAGGLDLWDGFRKQYENRRLKGSYLASYLYASIARRTVGRRYVEGLRDSAVREAAKWRKSLDYLVLGRDLTRMVGGRFAVVVFPFMFQLDDEYPFRELHGMVVEHCRSNRIPALDLLDAFRGQPYAELWVHPSDQHPNERAHRIAAEAIAAFVREEELLESAAGARSASR